MAGLRELKKHRTRELIASTAARLVGERGFTAVTIDEIAREAEVSRQTVFNYFPTKESMLFDRDAELRDALVAAVRDRAPGTSLVDALRGHTRAFWQQLVAALRSGPLPHDFWPIVRETPALQAYGLTMAARHADAVAAVIAAEHDGDPADPVYAGLAHAVCAVHEAAFAYGMNQISDGGDPEQVVGGVLARADAAYDLLASGIDSTSAV